MKNPQFSTWVCVPGWLCGDHGDETFGTKQDSKEQQPLYGVNMN